MLAVVAGWSQCNFTASISSTIVTCNGGSSTVAIEATSGGVTPYSFTFNGVTQIGNGVFTGIIAGTNYLWSVTDANNCSPIISGNLTITQPDPLLPGTINITTSQFCIGGTETIGGNPPVYSLASGGSGNYTYSWQIDEGCDGGWIDIPGTTGLRSYTPEAPATDGSFCYRRRVHDISCNTDEYTDSKRFEIFPELVSQNIVPSPSNLTVCSGVSISATFEGGSGGFPSPFIIDEHEFSTNGGSTWNPYIPDQVISTNGLSGINIIRIRTRRVSTSVNGCNFGNYVTTSWSVNPLPTATFSYSGSPLCTNVDPVSPTVNILSGGPFSSESYTSGAGLTINSSTGIITPGSSTPGTYTVTYSFTGANGCTNTSSTSVTITALPTAAISYAGSPFCRTVTSAQPVTRTGTGSFTGGIYTASPAGLTINSSTGAITPSASSPGTYTVTYTVPASGGCPAIPVTASATITALPVAAFSYAGTPYCSDEADPSPAFSGGGVAGTFTSTAGLVFVSASTGQVNLAASTPGTYTVTNTIAASGGCTVVSATSPITITALPAATISYAGTPFCRSVTTAQSVTLNGTGAFTGGIFTASPAGLTINSSTGTITPNTSTAGTYTVTYTIPASGGCLAVPVTTLVIINSVPTATISYSSNPFCTSEGPASPTITVLSGGPLTGTNFSSSVGLTINPSSGIITPGSSTPGTYTVTYSFTGANGCTNTSSTSVTTTALPTAAISYAGSPFCRTVTPAQPVTRTGTGSFTGGTYTASPAGLTINSSTGAITPSASTPGTYTVTYTVPASGGCPAVPVTASATITALPVAAFSYAGTPYCSDEADPSPAFSGGGVAGTFTSTAGLVFVSASTGQVNLAASTPGTYIVTNTIAASGGCAAVSATSPITITALPSASISYSGSTFLPDC